MHREYQPAPMAEGHAHEHDHDHQAELRTLVATTIVVGLLLGWHVLLTFWGQGPRLFFGISPALLAAILGGSRVIYLALTAALEGKVGADIALAIACGAALALGEWFVAAE